jgi:hypothetical protein
MKFKPVGPRQRPWAAGLVSLALGWWPAPPALAQPVPADNPAPPPAVLRWAQQLAQEVATACPAADQADQAALAQCRARLVDGSLLKRSLQDFVLWGRQRDPKLSLKETGLTQFAPDVLTAMYLPLFMFNGQFSVGRASPEGLYPVRLHAAFRNGLPPGQFPYPFWHEAEKWSMYERANQIILYLDPKAQRVKVAQFTVWGDNAPVVATRHVTPPAFDGQWMWTDGQGQRQPAVSLFDGLMDRRNPFVPALDASYRQLALRLREGQCFECHVPSNPDRSKRLVLLQTPLHAAGEIKRLMDSVRSERMPRDAAGIEAWLEPAVREALLREGAAFERALDSARAWEATHSASRTQAGGAVATR